MEIVRGIFLAWLKLLPEHPPPQLWSRRALEPESQGPKGRTKTVNGSVGEGGAECLLQGGRRLD